jgi:hypothetical protein
LDLEDKRRFAPATQRNRDPILSVLQRILPKSGTILEIASGTGEHAVFFAPALRPCIWQPSDPDPILRASILAWKEVSPSDYLRDPLDLDVCKPQWSIEVAPLDPPVSAVVNINMIHISPWKACLGLVAGASRILPSEGILYLYGPFRRQGQHTAVSNAEFDHSLRIQNPAWGVRDLESVQEVARAEGFICQEVVSMPANNLSVIFKRL